MFRKLFSFPLPTFLPRNFTFTSSSTYNSSNLPLPQPRRIKPLSRWIPPTFGVKPLNAPTIQQYLRLRKLVPKRVRRIRLPKLPQTQDPEVIYEYYKLHGKNFALSHYLIVFSRLAHIRPKSINTTHSTILKLINGLYKYKLYRYPKTLSNLIKYSSIIGIRDRTLWTKFIRSLRYTDMSNKPTDISLIVSFFSQSGLRGEDLWRDLQDLVERSLENNLTSYESIQLFLQGFSLAKKELSDNLRQKLVSQIKAQVSFVELYAIKDLVNYCYKFRFDDPELWKLLKKWTLYKLDRPTETFMSDGQFTFLVYSYGKAALSGLLGEGHIENKAFFDSIMKYYLQGSETLEKNPDNALFAYYGLITAFSSLEEKNEELKKLFTEFIVNNKESLKPRSFGFLLELISEDRVSFYLDKEVVKIMQAYILVNLPHFTIEQYYMVFGIINKLEEAEREKVTNVLTNCLAFYVYTNPQHKLIPKIFEELENKNMISQERIQDQKILFNVV